MKPPAIGLPPRIKGVGCDVVVAKRAEYAIALMERKIKAFNSISIFIEISLNTTVKYSINKSNTLDENGRFNRSD